MVKEKDIKGNITMHAIVIGFETIYVYTISACGSKHATADCEGQRPTLWRKSSLISYVRDQTLVA